jgi:hypothetical protein
MSNIGKIKVYKNKAREVPEKFIAYVPQYQALGIEPHEYKSPNMGTETYLTVKKTTSEQKPPVMVRQPYAEAVPSPVGRGRGPLPNIGNNVEQSWSGVDEELIDDVSLDPNHPMIDNNEYVSNKALGLPPSLESPAKPAEHNSPLMETLQDLEEDNYILFLKNSPLCSGPLEYVQEQTTALVFGEHESFKNTLFSLDDILVFKRIKLKVGVFL